VNPQPAPISLEYLSAHERRANPWLLRISLGCGTTAWTIGVAIVGFYWLTGADSLVVFGLGWLGIGGLLTLIALVTAAMFEYQLRGDAAPPRSSVRRSKLALLIALLNVPTAVVCVIAGGMLVSTPVITVVVSNVGTKPVQDSAVQIGNQRLSGGSIAPGASIHRRFRLTGGGQLAIDVKRNGMIKTFVLSSYTNEDDLGGGHRLNIDVADDTAEKK